jgi:hypothetical protein
MRHQLFAAAGGCRTPFALTREEQADMAKKKRKTPWERPAPAGAKHTTLTPAKRALAKKRAKRAGRSYPNLVDNMRVAKEQKAAKRSR